jgi:hypothetical protein
MFFYLKSLTSKIDEFNIFLSLLVLLYLMFSISYLFVIKKFNKTAMIVYNKRELKNSILVEEALSLKQIS